MTTFLAALRLAVNIEAELTRLQGERFRRFGDASSRLLPPVVPVALLPDLPLEGELDAFRKRWRLELTGEETNPVPQGTGNHVDPRDSIPSSAYRISIAQFVPMAAAFSASFPTSKGQPEESSTLARIVRADTADDRAVLRLGWTDSSATQTPPPLPVTAAFWLSVFEITEGDDPVRWWDGASWRLLYSRRFTSRRR